VALPLVHFAADRSHPTAGWRVDWASFGPREADQRIPIGEPSPFQRGLLIVAALRLLEVGFLSSRPKCIDQCGLEVSEQRLTPFGDAIVHESLDQDAMQAAHDEPGVQRRVDVRADGTLLARAADDVHEQAIDTRKLADALRELSDASLLRAKRC
jgi:hypothetical protein